MTGRRWLLLSLVGAASALLVGRGAAEIYTDYLWYSSLGATAVWRDRYSAVVMLRAVAAIVATAFVFANLYAVRQSVVSLVLPRRIGNLDIGEEVPRRRLTWTALGLSVIIGVALAWSQADWSGWVAARHGVPFGESDPYFAADLGFYVYWLPFELDFFTWMLTVILIVIGLVILLYALTPSLRWEGGSLYISGYVRRHLAILAGVLLIALAWHHRLAMFTILGGGGQETFGYLDHRVRIPAHLLLSLVTLGAGLTVIWAGWSGQMRLAFAAITGVLVATIGARVVAPFVVERVTGGGDSAARERPYVATRGAYTRRAFGVDRIVTVDTTRSFASLAHAAPHVPLWDVGALAGDARPLRGSDFAWSMGDAGLQVAVVDGTGGLRRFHPAAVGGTGQPVHGVEEARVAPLIVPDSARALVVVDSAGTIAAPLIGSGLSRFAHALSMQDFRIWLGERPGANTKVVARRTVRERVAALAPVFVQGGSITPVWSAGTLHWAMALYSASSHYPLSRPLISAGAERSYFQHAATALVNSSTGRVTLVADSARDPIAATWMQRFPSLVARPAAVPAAVRRHLQPPRESARAQVTAFARFGLRGERSDVGRQLPDDEGADSALAMSDAPLLGLPGAMAAGYVLAVLDRSDRVRGLFIATGGPSQRSIWWPLAESGPHWREAVDRLQAIDTISAPRLVRGYVRAVPVGRNVALVQPRYQWNDGERPRLLYVGIFEDDSVRIARSLGAVPLDADTVSVADADLRERAAQLHAEMRNALSRGDWVAFGRAFDELGRLLSQGNPRE